MEIINKKNNCTLRKVLGRKMSKGCDETYRGAGSGLIISDRLIRYDIPEEGIFELRIRRVRGRKF